MNGELRVLAVINGMGTGGAERSLSEVIPALSERGVRFTVACLFRRSEGVEKEIEATGVDMRFLSSQTWPSRILELRRLIRSIRPDVVHTTLFESDVIGRLAAIRTRVPVVTSLVNVSYEPVRLGDPNVRVHKLRLHQMVDALTARLLTRRFHAISGAVADSAIRRLGISPERITVVPRGRDLKRLVPRDGSRHAVRSTLGIPDQDFLILAVGRQEYQKGHRHLVEAFSDVSRRHSGSWLVLAGRKGAATEELTRTIADSADPGRIRVLGHRPDVPDLLRAADLFVFPSLYEGLGGALLEAMAVGLPIVASDIPAVREVGGATLAYAVPADPDDLGRHVARLIDDPVARREMGAAARRRFDDHFTLEANVDGMEAFYRAALS